MLSLLDFVSPYWFKLELSAIDKQEVTHGEKRETHENSKIAPVKKITPKHTINSRRQAI